jgi:hypothetical protein
LATKELAVASLQRVVLRFLFYQGIRDQKQYDCRFLCFPRLKIKLKGHHFDTTEVMEAESQAVLNTLTENNFRDVLEKISEALGMMGNTEGNYFVGEGGSTSDAN